MFGVLFESVLMHNLQCASWQTSAVRIVFFHFESNRIVIVGLRSHQ